MTDKNVLSLIEDLQRYDNNEGYELSYNEVKTRLKDTVRELVKEGEGALDHLHPLLIKEETWSCSFALRILKEIKNEKSIPHLISFIKKNEKGDYWDGCEDAMLTLSSLGEPAISPLLKAIRSDFKNNTYYPFLIGSLTKIKDDKVYSFMKERVEDFIKNYEQDIEWFNIIDFTLDFETQEKKEILPLLRELNSIEDLSEYERIEILDTISVIEDPAGFKQRTREQLERLEPIFETVFSKPKIGRNDPCPCGSGKKYKKCCMKK